MFSAALDSGNLQSLLAAAKVCGLSLPLRPTPTPPPPKLHSCGRDRRTRTRPVPSWRRRRAAWRTADTKRRGGPFIRENAGRPTERAGD